MKVPNLTQDEKYIRLYEDLVDEIRESVLTESKRNGEMTYLWQLYADCAISEEEFNNRREKLNAEELDAFANIATRLTKKAYSAGKYALKVLGENPSFEAIDNNLKAEIKYSSIHLVDDDYRFLAQIMSKFVRGEDIIIAMQRGRSYIYPNLDIVAKVLKENGLEEVLDEQLASEILYRHVDYGKSDSSWTQAKMEVIGAYTVARNELEKKASSSQPGDGQ